MAQQSAYLELGSGFKKLNILQDFQDSGRAVCVWGGAFKGSPDIHSNPPSGKLKNPLPVQNSSTIMEIMLLPPLTPNARIYRVSQLPRASSGSTALSYINK